MSIALVFAFIFLMIYWRGRNAVWGGATIGIIAGLIVSLVTKDWSRLALSFTIGVFIGTFFEWLVLLSKFLKSPRRFIICYGFGSVGSVARAMTRSYIAFRKKFGLTHREALLAMIENRYPKGKAVVGNEILPCSKEEIVDERHENLKDVIMDILFIENEGVRKVIENEHRYLGDVLEVVSEVVNEELNLSKMTL